MKKRVLVASLMVLLSVVLFSCGGGGGVGGGAEVFKTVTLTAQSSVNILDSDVAKHSANCDPVTDVPTYTADDVEVEIASTLNPGQPSSITGSAVRLESVKVKYKPATDTSKPLTEQKYALSTIVPANGSITVPIRVASQSMKSSIPLSELISQDSTATPPICLSNGTFSYFVTLEFEGTEIDTDKTATFETKLTVNFEDFADAVAPPPAIK